MQILFPPLQEETAPSLYSIPSEAAKGLVAVLPSSDSVRPQLVSQILDNRAKKEASYMRSLEESVLPEGWTISALSSWFLKGRQILALGRRASRLPTW